MPGNVSRLSVWLRPPETDNSASSSHPFTSRPSSWRYAARSVRRLLITRLRKVGKQLGRQVSLIEVRKLRNSSEAGQVPSVPRSLHIREFELLSVGSASNEAPHGEPSPAWCVLPCQIQGSHRALRSSSCLLVVTTWTANSFARPVMNSRGTRSTAVRIRPSDRLSTRSSVMCVNSGFHRHST